MKINYKKINPCFFFIGIIVSLAFGALNCKVTNLSSNVFLVYIFLSIFACSMCFYRFNNGLIALLRGRFAKPKRNDVRYVDYSECPIKNVEDFKADIDYAKSSLIAYKLNSREVYQIIKQSDGLLVRRCYPENGAGVECDFDNTLKAARGDRFIQYSQIKYVTYKISPNNYYLPIVSISAGNKHFRFIGYLEPFDRKDIDDFFSNIAKVRGKNVKKSPEEQINEVEKLTFKYNVIALLTCVVTPYNLFINIVSSTGKARLLWSIYAVISIVLLIIYLYVALAKSKRYKVDLLNNSKNDGKKDVSIGMVLLSLSIIVSFLMFTTIINFGWYALLCAIVFAVLIVKYFKTVKLPKGNSKENKTIRFCTIITCVIVLMIVSSALVSAVNYAVPVSNDTRSCSVVEMYAENNSKGESYYAKVVVDGKKQKVPIDSETYDSHASHINVTKSVGILGVKYIRI
jgi:hypothetical protein